MMTILILFHNSRVKTFKDFFIRILCRYHRSDFPRLLTYDRFVALIPRCFVPMIALFLATTGKCTGISFMDSTRLKICDNHRIHKHRTFRGIAKRGKSSMGWFFGFKLHAVINHLGDIIDVSITSGDTHDTKPVTSFGRKLFGLLVGDKGYLSTSLRETMLNDYDVRLITKVRRNMTELPLSDVERSMLQKRSLVETVFGKLKQSTCLDHTRHRSVRNFMVNIFSALSSYNVLESKPSLRNLMVA